MQVRFLLVPLVRVGGNEVVHQVERIERMIALVDMLDRVTLYDQSEVVPVPIEWALKALVSLNRRLKRSGVGNRRREARED